MTILRDPLIHFLLLGVLLFAGYSWVNPDAEESLIEVTPAHIAQMEQQWKLQWRRDPTQQEMDGLIESYIREEVLSREAIAMGLDQNDSIIRRRLMQKVDFLLDDVSELLEPDDIDLEAYYQANLGEFKRQPTFSFHHIYINSDKHSASTQYVANIKDELTENVIKPIEARKLSDPFADGYAFQSRTQSQLARIFGKDFSVSLAGLELGTWTGPITSGYGQHFVYLVHYQPAQQPLLNQVREKVLEQYRWNQRKELKEQAYKSIKNRYRVVVGGIE